jgi:hypothetical protein
MLRQTSSFRCSPLPDIHLGSPSRTRALLSFRLNSPTPSTIRGLVGADGLPDKDGSIFDRGCGRAFGSFDHFPTTTRLIAVELWVMRITSVLLVCDESNIT